MMLCTLDSGYPSCQPKCDRYYTNASVAVGALDGSIITTSFYFLATNYITRHHVMLYSYNHWRQLEYRRDTSLTIRPLEEVRSGLVHIACTCKK